MSEADTNVEWRITSVTTVDAVESSGCSELCLLTTDQSWPPHLLPDWLPVAGLSLLSQKKPHQSKGSTWHTGRKTGQWQHTSQPIRDSNQEQWEHSQWILTTIDMWSYLIVRISFFVSQGYFKYFQSQHLVWRGDVVCFDLVLVS